MTGFSITILFGGLVSPLRELMSPYKLNKIFIGGLVTGWGGLMSTYIEILCRGGPVTTSRQTQLNPTDPKEDLCRQFSRVLKDFDNATICNGVEDHKYISTRNLWPVLKQA